MDLSKKILIVEDEILISDYILDLLSEIGFTKLETANDSEEAQDKIKVFNPEIILMDINVDGKDTGIKLAENKNTEAQIIYVTAQQDSETIKKAITTAPISYLTKPIKKIDLLAAIHLAIEKIKTNFIMIKDGFEEIKILYDDIFYIKSDGNYIDLHTHSKTYSLRQSLESLNKLLDQNKFCKIHRSILINKTKIEKKTASSVFINNEELKISRRYKNDINGHSHTKNGHS